MGTVCMDSDSLARGMDRKKAFELALRYKGITKYGWAKEHRTWPGLVSGVLDGSRKSVRVYEEIERFTMRELKDLCAVLGEIDFISYYDGVKF